MLRISHLKKLLNWATVRAHLCTLAVAVSLNSTWRVPREAYRFGAVSYLLVFTIAMVIVALPATLLQLALGQLSQQDVVGVWRAVPFFKGVGYMRLLISYLASIYSIIYVALTTLIYLFFIVNNSIPLWECSETRAAPEAEKSVSKDFTCMNSTFLAPIGEQPEYYLALCMLTIVLWIIFPFIFYNPVKLAKRILYVLGPLVLLLMIVIASCIGSHSHLTSLHRNEDWRHYLESKVWYSAVTQALLSSQVAGGFLVSSGTGIYLNTNIQRTTLFIIGMNVACCWVGTVFWFSVAGGERRDASALAVLVQMYITAEHLQLNTVWPLIVYALLFFSGVISMLVFLYPLYDRFRRMGGQGWRIISFSSSFFGASAALGVLIGGLPALSVLEDTAVPFLVCIATVLEMTGFIFIYGRKDLVGDVEFLTGGKLSRVWMWGWFAAPVVVAALAMWSLVALYHHEGWTQSPWQAATIVATAATTVAIFFVIAFASVAKQVQYDLKAKLKSSFKPSRHWGPRDPITYYYWLGRRQESRSSDRNTIASRITRPQLGQMTAGASFLTIAQLKKGLEESV